jgi:hypothetical protein
MNSMIPSEAETEHTTHAPSFLMTLKVLHFASCSIPQALEYVGFTLLRLQFHQWRYDSLVWCDSLELTGLFNIGIACTTVWLGMLKYDWLFYLRLLQHSD